MWYFILVVYVTCGLTIRTAVGGFETKEACEVSANQIELIKPPPGNRSWLTTECEKGLVEP